MPEGYRKMSMMLGGKNPLEEILASPREAIMIAIDLKSIDGLFPEVMTEGMKELGGSLS